jgi:transcriptional repressor NrdR
MRCPFCGAADSRVVDSRAAADDMQIRRRRECMACKERFTTFESCELSMPRVIKSDGRRETFDEAKLRGGMEKALEKRPVSTDRLDAAMMHITSRLLASGEREVKARRIGELVMDELRQLDHVAYVRFASVYRSYSSLQSFVDEIERLQIDQSQPKNEAQLELLVDEQTVPEPTQQTQEKKRG